MWQLNFALRAELENLKKQHLWRSHKTVSTGVTPVVTLASGQQLINFSANDYLGLANLPELQEQAKLLLSSHAIGAGAAHLVTGHTSIHEALISKLTAITGYQAALLFSSGYIANIATIDAIMRPHRHSGVIYQDKLNHASLLDGARLSGVKQKRFAHLDYAQLKTHLGNETATCKLIISDHVFSMEGTQADTGELQAIANEHHAALMVDDAHGFGLSSHNPSADIYMATLGKAVGVSGAFVAGSGELIDYLRHKARGYVYSTATSPLTAALTLASLTYIENNKSRLQQQLSSNVALLKQAVQAQGWQTTHSPSHHNAIISLTLGTAEAAMQVAQVLQSNNLLVSAIRPPTVPAGTSRLRITVSAAHKQSHMVALIDALAKVNPTLRD